MVIHGLSEILMGRFRQDKCGCCHLGGVFWDSNGRWLTRFSYHFGACSILLDELRGIVVVLQLAVANGFREIILESDSAVAIPLILKDCPTTHPCRCMVDYFGQLAHQVDQVRLHHVFRDGNQVADWLAGHTHSLN